MRCTSSIYFFIGQIQVLIIIDSSSDNNILKTQVCKEILVSIHVQKMKHLVQKRGKEKILKSDTYMKA